jgi:hypothetical protein
LKMTAVIRIANEWLGYSASTGSGELLVAELCFGALAGLVISSYVRRYLRRRRPKKKTGPVSPPNHPVILPARRQAAQVDDLVRPTLPIEMVRELVGPPPRKFSAETERYLHAEPPAWLKRRKGDEMAQAFAHQQRIRREGPVVWAAIVQANSKMFHPGPIDSGASAIFSLDPWYDSHPDNLLASAREHFMLKGTDQADPDAAAFARMLTNEMTRAMMLRAPKRFTDGRNVFHSSVMMTRKHLPKGFVGGHLFPVWLDPAGTGAVLLVPAAYWPASLTSAWDRPIQNVRRRT